MENLLKYIFRFLFGYVKSFVLSWVVLPIVGAILFISTAFSGSLEFFLRKLLYLPILNPNSLSTSFDSRDIMSAFGFFSLGIYVILEVLKYFNIDIKPSFKRGFYIISSIFGLVLLLILYPTNDLSMTGPKSGFLSVFVVFWLVSILAYTIWYLLNRIKFHTL